MTTELTCYVYDNSLYTYDTAEYIRQATGAEKKESAEAGATGAFTATVNVRTLRSRCPMMRRAGQADSAYRQNYMR